jgi:hypothetical protein
MADELTESIARLCVTAGMLMDDITPDAIGRLTLDVAERGTKLADLRQVGADIAALLAAAEVLHRRADLSS